MHTIGSTTEFFHWKEIGKAWKLLPRKYPCMCDACRNSDPVLCCNHECCGKRQEGGGGRVSLWHVLPSPRPGPAWHPARLLQIPPHLQNNPLCHHRPLLPLGLGLPLLQPIRHLGMGGTAGRLGRVGPFLWGGHTPFPLATLEPPLMPEHASSLSPPHHHHHHRCGPQLRGVHRGLRLRMGAHQVPRMVQVRLHAIPPALTPVIRSTPSSTRCRALARRPRGELPPIAHCTRASPHVRASFVSFSW